MKVIGSHLCEDTVKALGELKEKNVEFEFVNISESLEGLKKYLSIRETNKIYENVRKAGGIGIPCFELEDGTVTLDLEMVMSKLK